MKTKIVVLLTGGMVAVLLLTRYFALSRAGIPFGWMLYLGLPITAAGVLFALRLANFGAGWVTKIDDVGQHGGAPLPPLVPPQSEAPVIEPLGERLKKLEALYAQGALSATEYSAQRLHIIATM